MISISLCMIVKNEEKVIARCLDSLKGLMDEIIIIDTGSTDSTKEIASKYTDRIYDYKWTGDFSKARNYSFSKASMDYIYTADADEILDTDNYKAFADLKSCMMSEVEIVQMKYLNNDADNNIQNSTAEYRPKLFKRVRSFTWIDPVHETVRPYPVVYDSDISVIHKPYGNHAGRDFEIFARYIRRGIPLSKRLQKMYAKELLASGTSNDFSVAISYFEEIYESEDSSAEERKQAECVLIRAHHLLGNTNDFFKYALKDMADNPCSEICSELGAYYSEIEDYNEAALWYYNAVYETECILNIHYSGDIPLYGLAKCYTKMSEANKAYQKTADTYLQKARDWKMPDEI